MRVLGVGDRVLRRPPLAQPSQRLSRSPFEEGRATEAAGRPAATAQGMPQRSHLRVPPKILSLSRNPLSNDRVAQSLAPIVSLAERLARLAPSLELPPAGRLKYYLRGWETLSSDPEVLETVTGMKLELCQEPPDMTFERSAYRADERDALALEVVKMSEKFAIELTTDASPQCVFTMFVVPKSHGGGGQC